MFAPETVLGGTLADSKPKVIEDAGRADKRNAQEVLDILNRAAETSTGR